MPNKTAIISGITGQDGPYLAKFLTSKGYVVVGITRREINPEQLDVLSFLEIQDKVFLETCDLGNQDQVRSLIEKYQPAEVYNLAAQSSVGYSFQTPRQTFEFNTRSVINLLEAIKEINKEIRLYQASSSEMFGDVQLHHLPIKESLLFHPVSPYGISKASAHWLAVNYREAYGLFTACGILFNHESVLRGPNFVIKKIIYTAVRIANGEELELTLGNLAVSRDWGYAPRYVEAMWQMLQHDQPEDFIICSGNRSNLQEIVIKVFDQLGIDLNKYLRLDQKYMRSLDLGVIYGDNTKAKSVLGWNYEMSTDDLVAQLIKDEKEYLSWKLETGNKG